LSSASGLQEVRRAQGAGVPVVAETCPQYLFLTADRLRGPSEEATNFVCTPPLRTQADCDALWEGVADGTIRVIATDHCPFTREDRRRGTAGREEGWSNFTEIPGGLPGVETRLGLAYQGVREGRFSPARWVEAVSTTAADIFGLRHRKGRLRPGLDADVVVFDPGATRRLDAAVLHMLTDHSPYEGKEVTGWPALVFSRG